MDKKDTNLLRLKIKMTNTTVYLHIYINVSVYLTIVVLAPPRFCISSSWPAFVQLPTINEQAWRRRMLQFNYFLLAKLQFMVWAPWALGSGQDVWAPEFTGLQRLLLSVFEAVKALLNRKQI